MTIAILCIILIVSAVAFSFIQTTYGTALAFLALCTAGLLPGVTLTVSAYLFWGRILQFPSPKFINYLCAKGLPAAIAMSMAGLSTALLMAAWPS